MTGKDDSVASWLNNKLGSSTHLWSFSSTVVSQYNIEKLMSIRDCFGTLDSLVKLKFFLSLFHIPKRCIEEFKPVIEVIIENTIQSCLDQWVLSIAMFVKTFWLTQSLDTQNEYELDSFQEALKDLKQILKECIETESGCERSRFLLPLEFDYLNREARFNVLPNTSTFTNEFLFSLTAEDNSFFTKHFNLFKSPKATCKLDDLKNKAIHYSKIKTTKSIMHTGLNSFAEYNDGLSTGSYSNRFNKKNELGLNAGLVGNDPYSSSYGSMGQKNQGSSSFFKRSMLTSTTSTTITGKSSNPKRNVGIKLLDVQEQVATPKEAKRKRKEQEKETLKRQKQDQQKYEKDDLEGVAKQEDHPKMDELTNDPQFFSHHGLPSENEALDIPHMVQGLPGTNIDDVPKPMVFNLNHNQISQNVNKGLNQVSSIGDLFQSNKQQSEALNSQTLAANLQSFQEKFNNSPLQSRIMNPMPNFMNQDMHQNTKTSPIKLEQFTTQSLGNPTALPTFKTPNLEYLPPQPLNTHETIQAQQQQALSLTQEQMLEAQEMFSNANCLSRPDKAQILGFIAGSRDNPQPNQGSLITIKLNEAAEIVISADGQRHSVISELYFEMNYDTGTYKKVKRYKN